MAAHIYTAFKQILKDVEDGRRVGAEVRNALHYAKLGDCLDLDDWRVLDNISMSDEPFASYALAGAIHALLRKYEKMWLDLGQPCTAREWMEVKYGSK